MSIAYSALNPLITLSLAIGLLGTVSHVAGQSATGEPDKPRSPASPAKQESTINLPDVRIPDGPAIDLSTLSLLTSPPWSYPKDDDLDLIEWIRSEDAKMPEDIRSVGTRGHDLKLTQERVDNLLLAAWYHYRTFDPSPHRVELLDCLCELQCLNEQRFLHAENVRNKSDFGAELTPDEILELSLKYWRPVVKLAESGFGSTDDPILKSRFVKTIGVAHLSVAGRFVGTQLFNDARLLQTTAADCFAAARRLDPKDREAVDSSIKLIDTLLQCGENTRAAKEAEAFLEKHPKSKYWPHVFYFLAKALRRDGKIREVLSLWEKYAPVLEAGETGRWPPNSTREPLPKWHSPDEWVVPEGWQAEYSTYAERILFYRGFYNIALGNMEEGKRLLQEFSVAMNERESTAKLLMPGKVYRDAMAFYYIANLNTLTGRAAPPIDLGEGWIQPPVEDGGTRATVLLFCDSSRAIGRHREFFHALAKLRKELWSKGLRTRWINSSTRRKGAKLEQQKEEMRLLAAELGVTGPCGIDPDLSLPNWQNYGVHRGAVHLFILDADSKVQWQLIDPMAWDIGLIRRVINRVISSASKQG